MILRVCFLFVLVYVYILFSFESFFATPQKIEAEETPKCHQYFSMGIVVPVIEAKQRTEGACCILMCWNETCTTSCRIEVSRLLQNGSLPVISRGP